MDNTQKFNLAKFNIISGGSIASSAVCTAKTESSCNPVVTYRGSGEASVKTADEIKQPALIIPVYPEPASAFTTSKADFINRIAVHPEPASVITGSVAKSAEIYGIEYISLTNLVLKPGQELIIDTDDMTATIDGQNAIHLLSDDSVFFFLAQGEDIITYADNGTSRSINLKVMRKDRWL